MSNHNELNRRHYYKKRNELIKQLGGKCVICGCTDYSKLEFDHINPFSKKIDISNKITSPNIIKEELGKIQLLCRNCHINKTKTDNSNLKRSGELNPMSTLTDEQVLEIREKYKPNIYSYNILAREYGVSKTTVINLVKHKYR